MHKIAKSARTNTAIPGLLPIDSRVRQTTGPDDQIVPITKKDFQFFEFADGNLIIRVREADNLAVCDHYAFTDTLAFASARGFADHVDRSVALTDLPCKLARSVLPIRGNDDLVGFGAGTKVVYGLGERLLDRPGFIVGRQDEADLT